MAVDPLALPVLDELHIILVFGIAMEWVEMLAEFEDRGNMSWFSL